MDASRRLKLTEVFSDIMFAKKSGGRYLVPSGWYPLLGLPGAIDIKEGAVLFCKLQKPVESEVQKFCLNSVVEKIRIHRSARVNGPDTMRVLASDLLHELDVCQVPIIADVEQLIATIRDGGGVISPDSSKTQIPAEKIEAFLKTKYRQ